LLAFTLGLSVYGQTDTTLTQALSFATPNEAASALIEAAEKFDEAQLSRIFGPNSYDIIHTGEPLLDRQQMSDFAAEARIKNDISFAPKNRNSAVMLIGNEDWPVPIPLVKKAGRWSFDAKAGRQELLFRRIGRNEITAIEVCQGFVEAQHEYALTKHDDSIVNQYAQRIISTPGKHDGLAWQNADGSWGGSISERAAHEIAKGYSGRAEPFHGYYFRVLKGQGAHARMGVMDFVIDDAMIGGFALVAFPAQYKVTGVMTFIVNQDGVVFEKDLGPKSLDAGLLMERFDPDKTWTVADVDFEE